MSLLISKLSPIGPDAAFKYLCEYKNSLGQTKKPNKFPLTIFGPNNRETVLLLKSLSIKRKPTLWNILVDAIEQERRKVFISNLDFPLRIESTDDFVAPESGKFVEKELTEEELEAILQA